jgi:hypothetical protein
MTETPKTKYIPCNGLNNAGLLHGPSDLHYYDLAQAERVARRNQKTHVATIIDDKLVSCEPITETPRREQGR